MRRTWMALGVGVPLVLALGVGLIHSSSQAEGPHVALLQKLNGPSTAAVAPAPPLLAGLDLTKISAEATAPLASSKVAHLTVDPILQRAADHVLSSHHIPEASVVLMDVNSGRILAYASHVEKGPARDLNVEATAPAASLFKIITGSALVEHAGLTAEQRECYSGGEQRIVEKDLVADSKRDKWCTTLSGAMGRSLNTVFAREAIRHLKPATLTEHAKLLGFGSALPFDVAVQPSAITVPDDSLGFARTAAGFWNTTLSPLHAAWLSAAIARGGEPVRPIIVHDVFDADSKKAEWTATTGLIQRRIMKIETADTMTTMLESTVSEGTSFRAFHDGKGRAFLPGVVVAGKTGTLTDAQRQRFYTWFTGFAPSKPMEEKSPPKVAIAVLVVNEPSWTVKANVVAREVLRAYFAEQQVPGVTAPKGDTEKRAKKEKRDGN